MIRWIFTTVLIVGLSGCSAGLIGNDPKMWISMDRLRAHLQFLASDELEGREAGTRGEALAARYIASQLEQNGIKPYALNRGETDSIGYFQKFTASKTTVSARSRIEIADTVQKKSVTFQYGDDFSNFHDQVEPCDFGAPLIFAGYGITAPEFDHDDYAGLDVRGKIVILLDGEPPSVDENYFYGAITSSYSSALFYKRHRAQELGAKAVLVVAYESLRLKWKEYVGYFKGSHMDFDYSPPIAGEKMPYFFISQPCFEKLIGLSDVSGDSLARRLLSKQSMAKPVFKSQAVFKIERTFSQVQAMNVIGYIEGRDPVLKNEMVAIGAHFDHMGVDASGNIFNGADDDASGTTAILEVARVISQSKANKRSLLVVFHGAEEKGLIGSKFLTNAQTPNIWKWNQVVAQINMDMVGRESSDSLFVIGAGRLSSELQSLTEAVNRDLNLFKFDYTFDRDDDPNQFYFRSDHYNYAKLGIPIVFFFDGMTSDYHQATDDYHKINFIKLHKTATLATTLAMRIANLDHRLPVDRK